MFLRRTASLPTLVILVSITLALGGCSKRAETRRGEGTPVLSGPPNTTYPLPPANGSSQIGWTLPNEQHVKFSDYLGKVVVLDFYATWCEPCRNSAPHLVGLQQRYNSQGLQVVGLNVGGPDDRDKVADFAREFGVEYPLGFPDVEMIDSYLADDDRIPQTFVFDRKGQLVKRLIGYGDSTGEELDRVIQTSLAAD